MNVLAYEDYVEACNIAITETGKLRIEGWKLDCIKAVSYGIRIIKIPETWQSHFSFMSITPIRNGNTFIIRPNETIHFLSEEIFHLPKDIFGFSHTRVVNDLDELARSPIMINPLFSNRLRIIVTNLGKQNKIIDIEEFRTKVVLYKYNRDSGEVVPHGDLSHDSLCNKMLENIKRKLEAEMQKEEENRKQGEVKQRKRKRKKTYIYSAILAVLVFIPIYFLGAMLSFLDLPQLIGVILGALLALIIGVVPVLIQRHLEKKDK